MQQTVVCVSAMVRRGIKSTAPDLERIPSSWACCESGCSARGRCRWNDKKNKRASDGGAGGPATADLLVSMPERGGGRAVHFDEGGNAHRRALMQVLKEVASKVEHPGTRVPGRLARPPPMSFFPFRSGGGRVGVCLGASAPKKLGACVWRGEAETRPTVSGWGMVPIFPELSSAFFPHHHSRRLLRG